MAMPVPADSLLSASGPGGTVTGSYDAQDRLAQYGATTYTYTANRGWALLEETRRLCRSAVLK